LLISVLACFGDLDKNACTGCIEPPLVGVDAMGSTREWGDLQCCFDSGGSGACRFICNADCACELQLQRENYGSFIHVSNNVINNDKERKFQSRCSFIIHAFTPAVSAFAFQVRHEPTLAYHSNNSLHQCHRQTDHNYRQHLLHAAVEFQRKYKSTQCCVGLDPTLEFASCYGRNV
jgi:hypothetical protein